MQSISPTKKLTSIEQREVIWSCPQEEVSTDFKIKDNEHKPSLMSNTYLSLYSHIKNMYKLQVMTGSGKKQDIRKLSKGQCSCQGGECSQTCQTFKEVWQAHACSEHSTRKGKGFSACTGKVALLTEAKLCSRLSQFSRKRLKLQKDCTEA